MESKYCYRKVKCFQSSSHCRAMMSLAGQRPPGTRARRTWNKAGYMLLSSSCFDAGGASYVLRSEETLPGGFCSAIRPASLRLRCCSVRQSVGGKDGEVLLFQKHLPPTFRNDDVFLTRSVTRSALLAAVRTQRSLNCFNRSEIPLGVYRRSAEADKGAPEMVQHARSRSE